MADIELVIKIPEEMYKAIKYSANGFSNYLHSATRIGTPLPKGHGDLIDSNVLCEQYEKTNGDLYQALDLTHIIIEADKGE